MTGVGTGNAKEKIGEKITGYKVSVHNNYLYVLFELGIIPFLIFIIICIRPIIISKNSNPNLRNLLSPIFGYILGIYAFWLFHDSYINSSFWITYFLFCNVAKSNSLLKRVD